MANIQYDYATNTMFVDDEKASNRMIEYAAVKSKNVTINRISNRKRDIRDIPQFQEYLAKENLTYDQWKFEQRRKRGRVDPDLELLELKRRRLGMYKNKKRYHSHV